ncbi:unnamed protein product [Gongylonema pulchrum]|uniref:SHSP domain-containing protein n=1 Tax=Gongylonema pulchrum TaxID=637853 RepID=A0A183DQZ9_9BILA|nr:unnamed protein product [Gongylonema pulchrum]
MSAHYKATNIHAQNNVERHGRRVWPTDHILVSVPVFRGTAASFVQIRNGRDRFEAQIDLEYFTAFRPDEIDVSVCGHDLQIYADRENPNNPNYSARRLSRQYRLPEDTDVNTINILREKRNIAIRKADIAGNCGLNEASTTIHNYENIQVTVDLQSNQLLLIYAPIL